MSIIEDIESVLTLHEEYVAKSKITTSFSSRQSVIFFEDEYKLLLEDYQMLKEIANRSALVLSSVREQYQESRHRCELTQTQFQNNKNQIHNLLQEIEKLKERIAYLQNQDENLRQQIIHLQQLGGLKDKEQQLKEERSGQLIAHMQEQHSLLSQYAENISLKYKSLQTIAEKQGKRRELLEEEQGIYRKQQQNLLSTINALNLTIDRNIISQRKMEKQLRMYEDRVQQLQAALAHRDKEQFELDFDIDVQEKSQEIPAPLLSEQISNNEKICVPISFDHSFEFSHHETPHQSIHQQLERAPRKISINQQEPSLRRVASNGELPSHKKIWGSFRENDILKQAERKAEQKLKNAWLSTEDKVIVETQGTERECETDQSMREDGREGVGPMDDPYFIHYLLTVQSVKISQDEQGLLGILQVDMKPYYFQLINSKLSLSKWGEWIKEKLISISLAEDYQP